MKYPDGEFTFNVSVPLKDFYEVWALFDTALRRVTPDTLKPFVARFGQLAAVQREGVAVDLDTLDVNLVLALGRDWMDGVRNVPLPLPERSSDGAPSEDPSPATSPEPSSGTPSSDDGPDTPLRL